MSRRRLNNPLDLTELEFKEVSNRKLRKFQELAKTHNHIVVIGRNGVGKSTVLKDFKYTKNEIAYIDCARGQAIHSESLIMSHDPEAIDEAAKKLTYSEGEYLFHTIKARVAEALDDGATTLILDEIDSGFSLDRLIMTFRGIKDFAPNIKLYIAINSFEALEAFKYFYDNCVIYNAETNKVIKCLDSYEAYTKEILSPIMKAFGKDLAFFKDFIRG